MARFWFSPAPEERQKLMVELHRYYETGEGRSWGFSDTRYCQPGTFLAARYSSRAFHRVTVLDTFPAYDRVRVLFIDYGTIQAVPVRYMSLGTIRGQGIKVMKLLPAGTCDCSIGSSCGRCDRRCRRDCGGCRTCPAARSPC